MQLAGIISLSCVLMGVVSSVLCCSFSLCPQILGYIPIYSLGCDICPCLCWGRNLLPHLLGCLTNGLWANVIAHSLSCREWSWNAKLGIWCPGLVLHPPQLSDNGLCCFLVGCSLLKDFANLTLKYVPTDYWCYSEPDYSLQDFLNQRRGFWEISI